MPTIATRTEVAPQPTDRSIAGGWLNAAVARGLVAAMIAGLALAYTARLFAPPTLWLDEAMLLANVRDVTWRELLRPLPYYDQVAPLGYIALLKTIFAGAGLNEALLRLPSLLAFLGALSLCAVLPDTRPTTRAIAAAVIAGSFVLARVATDAKPYTFDLLFALTLVIAFHPAAGGRWRHPATQTALLLAAVALTVSFPLIFAAIAIPAMIAAARADIAERCAPWHGKTLKTALPLALAAAAYALYYANILGPALGAIADNHDYNTYLGYHHDGDGAYLTWLGLRALTILQSHAGDALPILLAATLTGIAALTIARSIYVAQIACLCLVATSLNIADHYPLFEERFSVYMLPWIAIAAGTGITAITQPLPHQPLRAAAIAALGAVCLAPAAATLPDPFHQNARTSLAMIRTNPQRPVIPFLAAQPILDIYAAGRPLTRTPIEGGKACLPPTLAAATTRCTRPRDPHDGPWAGTATKWYLMNYIAAATWGGTPFGFAPATMDALRTDYFDWLARRIRQHPQAHVLLAQGNTAVVGALRDRLAPHGHFTRVADDRPPSPTLAHGAAQLFLFERKAP